MTRLETPPLRTTSRRSSPAQETVRGLSIGEYLIRRLGDYGIEHVFGIPGDYVLSFYNLLEQGPLKIVGCTREDCAGFAADAYARVHGMGAVCVTYCVGGLSLCNSIAGAYAEKSPVVVISGSPGLSERVNNPLLHHKVRDFRTQLEVFEKLCVAAIELSDPVNAFREIDRVLDLCASVKRPVYLEIPRDMVHVVPEAPHSYKHVEARSAARSARSGGGRSGAMDRFGETARDHRRGRNSPLRFAGRVVETRRGRADSGGGDDARKERRP